MINFRVAFATELRRCLVLRYGKMPSSARIARDFTLASSDSFESVSIETIRKWTHGVNLPQSERMHFLAIWLNFDPAKLNYESRLANLPSLNLSKKYVSKRDSDLGYLVKIYPELNEEDQMIIMQLIASLYKGSLSRRESPPPLSLSPP